MAISFVSSGAFISGVNTSITPIPGTYAVGDALLYCTGESFGSDSQTAPAGWQQLSFNSTVTGVTIWGRIAQSASETIPSVSWGATNRGWAEITVLRGVDPSFTSTMTGSAERGANSTSNIIGSASSKTPTQDNCVALFVGGRNKTSATDGNSYATTGGFQIAAQISPNGSTYSALIAYLIQTTAASVAANMSFVGSPSVDVSTQPMRSTMIFLAPAASSGGGGGGTGTVAFPPPKRKTYVFYDLYYPR
jgi:hypothetical protein